MSRTRTEKRQCNLPEERNTARRCLNMSSPNTPFHFEPKKKKQLLKVCGTEHALYGSKYTVLPSEFVIQDFSGPLSTYNVCMREIYIYMQALGKG